MVAFVVVAAAIDAGLEMQVELGFLAGADRRPRLVMGWALAVRMRRGVPEGIGSLITQIEHEPLEI